MKINAIIAAESTANLKKNLLPESLSGQHTHGHQHNHHAPGATPGHYWLRLLIAFLLVLLAGSTACMYQVRAGRATVMTRFGDPERILLTPGLAWRWPMPFEEPIDVDLRIRSTSSGLEDVGTKDGLRVIMQAWAIWKVKPDDEHVLRFIRAVQNQPDEAARQIRTFIGSALETTASNYNLSDIVNTDASQIRFAQMENSLRAQLQNQLMDSYGIDLVQVGIERLTLPAVTLNATVDRMRAERESIATERTAEGKRTAAEIHATADRQARIIEADASVKAADLTASAQKTAAGIYGQAFASNPKLYTLLRSMDTVKAVVNKQTQMVFRTDTPPFDTLVNIPDSSLVSTPTTQTQHTPSTAQISESGAKPIATSEAIQETRGYEHRVPDTSARKATVLDPLRQNGSKR